MHCYGREASWPLTDDETFALKYHLTWFRENLECPWVDVIHHIFPSRLWTALSFFLAQGIWPGGIIHINKKILFRRNLCNDNGNGKADHKDHRCVDFTVHPKPKKRGNIHNNIKKKEYWSTCSFCQGSWWSPHHSRPVSASGCAERFPPLQSLQSLKSLKSLDD